MSIRDSKDVVGYKGKGGYPKACCYNCSFGEPEKNRIFCTWIQTSVFRGGRCKHFYRDPLKGDFSGASKGKPKKEK